MFLINIAVAPPPPLHIPIIPYFALFLFNTFINDNVILAPLIPTGCPNDTAPPCILIFYISIFNIFDVTNGDTENASFISQ